MAEQKERKIDKTTVCMGREGMSAGQGDVGIIQDQGGMCKSWGNNHWRRQGPPCLPSLVMISFSLLLFALLVLFPRREGCQDSTRAVPVPWAGCCHPSSGTWPCREPRSHALLSSTLQLNPLPSCPRSVLRSSWGTVPRLAAPQNLPIALRSCGWGGVLLEHPMECSPRCSPRPRPSGLLAGGDGHQLHAAVVFHHPGQAHQHLLAGRVLHGAQQRQHLQVPPAQLPLLAPALRPAPQRRLG